MIGWLIARGLSERAAKLIVGLGILLIAAIAVVGWFALHDAQVIENHEAKTSAKLERTGRQADASAAQRVETRRRAEATARKDFDNATAGIPDNGLTVRQRIDLCRELHDGGVDTTVIAECSDVRAGEEAAP